MIPVLYRSLQIRCLKLTTIARYACAFDCTNLFTFRQCACVLIEKQLKKWTTDLQITVKVQLFAKILHNGSESGSMTLANQTHVGVTNWSCTRDEKWIWLASVTLPLSLPLCKIFANNCIGSGLISVEISLAAAPPRLLSGWWTACRV